MDAISKEKLKEVIDINKWVGGNFEFLWDTSIDAMYMIMLYSKDAKKTREMVAFIIIQMLQYPDLDPALFKKHENYHYGSTFKAMVDMWNRLVKLYPIFNGVFTIKADSSRSFAFYRQKGNKRQEVQFFSLDNPTKLQGIEPYLGQHFWLFYFDEPVDVDDANRKLDFEKQELVVQTIISSLGRHSGGHKLRIYATMNAYNMNSWWIYHFFVELAELDFFNDEYIDYLIENGRWDKYMPEEENGLGVFVSNGNWRVNEFITETLRIHYLSMEEDYFNGQSNAALPVSIGIPGAIDNYPLFDLSNHLEIVEVDPEKQDIWFSTWDYGINDATVGYLWSIELNPNSKTGFPKLSLWDFREYQRTRNVSDIHDKVLREREWAENINLSLLFWKNKYAIKQPMTYIDSKEGFVSTLWAVNPELIDWPMDTLDRLKQIYPMKVRAQMLRNLHAKYGIQIAKTENSDVIFEKVSYIYNSYQEVKVGSSDNIQPLSPVMDEWDALIYGVIIFYNELNIPIENSNNEQEQD